MNERYYKIGYGCGCGNNEDYIMAMSLESAEEIAYEAAVEDYEFYEGRHGIRGVEDIAIDDYGLSEEDYIPDKLYEQIYQDYLDEKESQLDYWAEEITEKEYLIGIGELDEEDE